MSNLLQRLKALRGESATVSEAAVSEAAVSEATLSGATLSESAATATDPAFELSAAQLDARLVRCDEGIHLAREVRLHAETRHGTEPLGDASLHPLLLRQAGASPGRLPRGPVLYIDTETTGLAGGTGTFAFLIGVGLHGETGFEVRQLFLPGPEHERSQLKAFASLVSGASALVTYNGASFDLPLLRNRFALHGMADPLAGVPHLDLLTVARRLWRESLPDCTLATVERRVLSARRSLDDVPGFEVPARYFAFLQSRDASGLRGVIEHNETDIVALTALRSRIERLILDPTTALAQEAHALGLWMERLGEAELALARYLEAAGGRWEAAWRASLVLKRLGRLQEAADLWLALGRQGQAAAWVELAKAQEHRWRDYRAALASVDAAAACRDCEPHELKRRRARLLRRLVGAA
jgi:uncharacterized protein YprB with RNaseH-like and TPR domain